MNGSRAACSLLALFLAAGTAGCASDVGNYEPYGADLDGPDLGAYGAWDVDRSGLLDEKEFYAGTFDSWDVDDDSLLSEREFLWGTDRWPGGATDFGAFDDWDEDRSGLVDETEFYDGVADVGA